MTTATRTSASAELRKLQAARDKAHALDRAAKAKVDTWDAEGLPAGVELRTVMGNHHVANREQAQGPNPHRPAYEEARASYFELDLALQAFKRESVRDRIEEVPVDHAIETIRNALRLLAKGCEEYEGAVAAVRDVVIDTPPLNGQHYGHDPRPNEWLRLAVGTLDGEIAKPRLTPQGEAKLDG